jgi:hypothetical protein
MNPYQLGRIASYGWLFWGGVGAGAGLSASVGIKVAAKAELNLSRFASLGAIGGFIVGLSVLSYILYCRMRDVSLVKSALLSAMVLFSGALALMWRTDPQLGWSFGLFLSVSMALLLNMAIISASLRTTFAGILRTLWAESLAVVGCILSYLIFYRLIAGHFESGKVTQVLLYRGLGIAVIGGSVVGWFLGKALDRFTDSGDEI